MISKTVIEALDAPAQGIDAVLQERGTRYGVFADHADITQDLKDILFRHLGLRNKVLAKDQQEALDMVFHKIGRIVNGDANYVESWRDCIGYLRLVESRLLETDGATDARVTRLVRKGGAWVEDV